MGSNKRVLAGWILSALIAAFLILASGIPKFIEWEGKAEIFAKMGWNSDVMLKIGVVEIVLAILFLVPRTAFIAAVLLTAYLGGAVATHIRVGDAFFFPIIIGILVWVALGLRDSRVFATALRQPGRDSPTPLK
jgi:multidrug efflux pump subunit AcrB